MQHPTDSMDSMDSTQAAVNSAQHAPSIEVLTRVLTTGGPRAADLLASIGTTWRPSRVPPKG
jgi:hypothetical protein